jgi:hypothetical protein
MDKILKQRLFKYNRSRSGKTIFSKKHIGYLVAGKVGNKIAIGYSMCHKNDRFNFIKGKHVPGWGEKLATTRAEQWVDSDFIEVPPSIFKQTQRFIDRCERYYKDISEGPGVLEMKPGLDVEKEIARLSAPGQIRVEV